MVVLEKGRLEMKGSSVLWKIIFVFLGVTILPVVVILAFFYPQNYEVLNHVIEDGLTEPSQRAVERLDEEFLKMFGASLELKSSIQNIAREESGTYLYSRQIKNLLKAVRGRSELVETVLWTCLRYPSSLAPGMTLIERDRNYVLHKLKKI